MILLTKADKAQIHLNPFQIENFCETPDMVIQMTNGKRFVVKENAAEVNRRIREFWNSVFHLEKRDEPIS